MAHYNRIVIELGTKKVFASALDWPGWSRGGRDEKDAMIRLIAYADRYRTVTDIAGVDGIHHLVAAQDAVERFHGTGATDFGVPDRIAESEYEWMSVEECERQLALLQSCWTYFDTVAGTVSEQLRKGPRGGGRDRDAVVEHTLEADRSYARQIGIRTPKGYMDIPGGLAAHRRDVVNAVRTCNADKAETKWPLRYYIRRAAWHLLDHAWEMEDKDLRGEDSSS